MSVTQDGVRRTVAAVVAQVIQEHFTALGSGFVHERKGIAGVTRYGTTVAVELDDGSAVEIFVRQTRRPGAVLPLNGELDRLLGLLMQRRDVYEAIGYVLDTRVGAFEE